MPSHNNPDDILKTQSLGGTNCVCIVKSDVIQFMQRLGMWSKQKWKISRQHYPRPLQNRSQNWYVRYSLHRTIIVPKALTDGYMTHPHPVFFSVSVHLYVSLQLSMCLSLCNCRSVSGFLPMSLSMYMSLSLCFCLSASVSVSGSLSRCIHVVLSLCHYVSVQCPCISVFCVCFSAYVFVILSLCASLPVPLCLILLVYASLSHAVSLSLHLY